MAVGTITASSSRGDGHCILIFVNHSNFWVLAPRAVSIARTFRLFSAVLKRENKRRALQDSHTKSIDSSAILFLYPRGTAGKDDEMRSGCVVVLLFA